MLYISISDQSIDVLQGKKNIFGKEHIVASSRKVLPHGIVVNGDIKDGEKLLSELRSAVSGAYPNPIEDKEASLVISDEQSLTVRFLVPGRELKEREVLEEARKITQHEPFEYENFYRVIEDKKDMPRVLFTAVPIQTVRDYSALLSRAGLKCSFLTLRSFAFFENIKRLIPQGQTVLVCFLEKKIIDYALYDVHGPILSSVVHVGAHPLPKETHRIIEHVKNEHKNPLAKIFLSGEESLTVHPQDIPGADDMMVLRVNDMLDSLLQKKHIAVDTGGAPIVLFATVIGLLSSIWEKSAPDIARDVSPSSVMKQEEEAPLEEEDEIVEYKKSRMPFIIIMVCVALGIVLGWWMIANSKTITLPFAVKPTVTPIPTIAPPKVTPTPTINPDLERGDLKMAVQNGTAKVGYAKDIASFLEEKGYKSVGRSNADKQDYEKTVLRIKDTEKDFLPLLLSDLQEKFPDLSTESLPEENAQDVILILGLE